MAVQETKPRRRKYELKVRAERERETRRRIVQATVDLHGEIGPVRTTVTAIAERAGVQRHTFYRHFPDERSLFEACSGHFRATHAWPEPESWRAIRDPEERLCTGLAELYADFRATERRWACILADAESDELVREIAQYRFAFLRGARDVLAEGWGVRGRRRASLVAAIGHAVDFRSWESLVRRQGLTDAEAVEAMATFVRATAKPC
jgi:AcrR family transcriptional regulator